MFLNLILPTGQFLIPLLFLEWRANFAFGFLCAFVSICNVSLQPGRTILEPLHSRFEHAALVLPGKPSMFDLPKQRKIQKFVSRANAFAFSNSTVVSASNRVVVFMRFDASFIV